MGRGRTTTGMIIASLLALRRVQPELALPAQPQEGLPAWYTVSDKYPSPSKVRLGGMGRTQRRAGRNRLRGSPVPPVLNHCIGWHHTLLACSCVCFHK
jgi:hypothetical protein